VLILLSLSGTTAEKNLAAVYRGHFFAEPGITQTVDWIPPTGIRLINASTPDDGLYFLKINVNKQDIFVTYKTNVSLLVIGEYLRLS
jgi:hypothetical protein